LVADTGGHVDVAAVRRYHSGRAEVKGFDIADKAVVGDVEGAVEALRWAMLRGEPHVVLADALAEAIHSIGRVGSLSGDPYRLAAELGMPPWRVQKAQKTGAAMVPRFGGYRDAAGGRAERRRERRSRRRGLCAGSSGEKGCRARRRLTMQAGTPEVGVPPAAVRRGGETVLEQRGLVTELVEGVCQR